MVVIQHVKKPGREFELPNTEKMTMGNTGICEVGRSAGGRRAATRGLTRAPHLPWVPVPSRWWQRRFRFLRKPSLGNFLPQHQVVRACSYSQMGPRAAFTNHRSRTGVEPSASLSPGPTKESGFQWQRRCPAMAPGRRASGRHGSLGIGLPRRHLANAPPGGPPPPCARAPPRPAGPRWAREGRRAMVRSRALWSCCLQLAALPSAAGWSGGKPQPFNGSCWRAAEPPWRGWSGSMEEEEEEDETPQGQRQPGRWAALRRQAALRGRGSLPPRLSVGREGPSRAAAPALCPSRGEAPARSAAFRARLAARGRGAGAARRCAPAPSTAAGLPRHTVPGSRRVNVAGITGLSRCGRRWGAGPGAPPAAAGQSECGRLLGKVRRWARCMGPPSPGSWPGRSCITRLSPALSRPLR